MKILGRRTLGAMRLPMLPRPARKCGISFLLKLLAVETAILITVGLLAVMGRDYFAWLLS